MERQSATLEVIDFIETPMTLNEFNVNSRYEDVRGTIQFIINLIYMNPGMIPEQPKMGYGLDNRRHFLLSDAVISKQIRDLEEQVSTYCSNLQITNVDMYMGTGTNNESVMHVVFDLQNDKRVTVIDEEDVKIKIATISKDFNK